MAPLADRSRVSDAYNAESLVSVLLGMMIQAGMGGDRLAGVLLDLTDEFGRRDVPHSYPALRTLAVIGPPEVSEYATRAAERVEERADDAPAWIGDLGKVVPGACVIASDPTGETHVLSCEFTYANGSRPHAVWAMIDMAWHGAATTLVLADDPADARRGIEKDARRIGATVREISAAQAAPMLLAGIDALLRYGPPPGQGIRDEGYSMACSFVSAARSRAASLLGADAKPPTPDDVAARWPPQACQRLAEEFLAAPQASELRDQVSRTIPLALIRSSVDLLGCDPRLIGPVLLERLVLHVIPASVLVPDRFGDAIVPVLRAWTDWLAEQRGLDRRDRRKLTFRLEYLLRKFPARWTGPTVSPLRRYVQDLPDEAACDGTAVNAASEADRVLITLHDLSARGVPQDRFEPYIAVVRHLWTDSPPDVWAAAKRMSEAGLPRNAILDRLASAWENSGEADPAAYPTALARLGARAERHR
jgi:hypothetical protein